MTELTEFTELNEAPENYDRAGQVIGLAMKVHRSLGPGFNETVYKRALQHEILKSGHLADLEKPITVLYDGVIVGDFFADMLVDGELLVEAKAVQILSKAHEVQLVNYLTATGLDHGLLLNFGAQSLEFKKKFRRSNGSDPPSLH